MTAEEALEIIEQAVAPRQLNKIQRLVFWHAWQGQPYMEIAGVIGYDCGYIKDIGSKLWQMLSEALSEKVTKQNVQAVLKGYIQQTEVGVASRALVPPIPEANILNLSQDWGEAVDASNFYNRSDELAILHDWIAQDRCRLVAILGMGGVGKTTLSVKLAEQVQDEFEYLIWRSLRNAPPIQEILATLVEFLSNQQEVKLPETLDGQVSQLIKYLRASRCLLILDNAESILQVGSNPGRYREGYEGYGQLLRCVAETCHQSCLVLTSREKPRGLDSKEGGTGLVRSLQLAGLPEAEAQELLKVDRLSGSDDERAKLIRCYGGNPLALKIISTSIQVLFNGNICEFLEQGTTVFNGIRQLLDQQCGRLSDFEKQVMYWLAINREPVSVGELQSDIVPALPTSVLLETLESLRGRSLIECTTEGFTQQPVVMEYAMEQFITHVCTELTNTAQDFSTPFLCRYALMKATAKDYVRESQIRVIIEPIVNQTISQLGSKQQFVDQLSQLLSYLRTHSSGTCGYAIGNLINLCNYLQIDLTGLDVSHLPVWQAYLADVKLQHVNFAHANLTRSVFAETFGGVSCVAFSPNGQWLATSDTSGKVQIWEIASGRQLNTFKADVVWTWSVTFSPDGQWLASAGDDCQVKLWDVKTGRCVQSLLGHTSTVNAITFHPAGQLLASCGQDATIRLWRVGNFEKPSLLQVLQGHQGRVWSVAFSPVGDTLVSGSEDQTLKLWDIDTGACQQTLVGHLQWVKSVAFSPDGQSIASGSFDGTISLWSTSTGQCLHTWQGHPTTVTSLAFSPDEQAIASASYDQTVKVWDLASRQCIKMLKEHSNRVWSVAFSPNGQYLASGGDDHATRLWHLKTGRCAKAWKGHTNSILSLAQSRDQQLVATGHEDQTVKLWHLQTGQVSKTLHGHTNRVWSVAFAPQQTNQNPDEVSLASGSADRTIKLWNIQTEQCLKTLYGHTSWVWSVAFSPDGHRLASSSYDQTVKLWDVYSGECLKTLDDHTAPVVSVTYDPQGQWLASSSFDTTIKLWEAKTGECLKTFKGHGNSVWALAFSPDRACIASCSYDQTVKLWDLHTGTCLHTFEGHSGPVVSLAFNVSGHHLASCSFDRTVKLWDIKTRQCLHTLYGHTALVSTLVFQLPRCVLTQVDTVSDSYEILLSGSFDETLRVWDARIGECLQTMCTPHPYDGMNITGTTGLTEAEKATLKALGAVEVETVRTKEIA